SSVHGKLRVRRWLARLCVLALATAGAAVGLTSPAQAAPGYVYTTFKGDAAADQALWVYSSADGTNFSVLADTNYRGPSGALRDPSVIRHHGLYRTARTVQSWTTNSTHSNIASSPDLINWTHVASVGSGSADTRVTWAPEFYVEGGTVRIIVSIAQTTCSDCFRPCTSTAHTTTPTSRTGP